MTQVIRGLYNVMHYLSLPVLFGVTARRVRAYMPPFDYFRARLTPQVPFPDATGTRATLWVHAVSVGEVLTAIPLLQELDRIGSPAQVVLSTVTPTGYHVAREHFTGPVFLFPLDLAQVVRRFLRHLRPRLFVAMETEIWPELFFALRERSIPIIIANGRISDESYPKYLRIRFFLRRVLACVDRVGAQSPEHAERFVALGAATDRVTVTGNLKFDSTLVRLDQAAELPWLDQWRKGRRLLVFGSWLEDEWEFLPPLLTSLHAAFPDVAILLAPRHIEHAPNWVARLRDRGLSATLRTQLDGTPASIVVLDTYGELAATYRQATVAVVGGSFRPGMAGHNPIEPASCGIPVVIGPYFSSFRDVVQAFRERSGILIHSARELHAVLTRALQDEAWRIDMGRRARATVEAHQGATRRTLELIGTVLTTRIDKDP